MNGISIKRAVIKNTGIQMVAHVLSLIFGLATAVILSRYLGVEGFGQFSYIFAFFYFFLMLNDFGINTVVVREITQCEDRAAEIIGSTLFLKLFIAIASVLLAWVTIALMKLPGQLRDALFLYALILPVTALQFPSVIFQSKLKLAYPSVIGMINRLLSFLLILIAVGKGYGLKVLVLCLVTSEVITLLIMYRYALRFVRPALKIDFKIWKHILGSSLTVGLTSLFVALINRVDFIMLERMTDLQAVGLYAAAYKVTNLLEALPLMFMATLYPVMAHYAKKDPARLDPVYRKSVTTLAWVALPMGLTIACVAPALVRLLFGEQFAGAAHALRILVWATVFLYLAITGGNLLISLGKERVNLTLNAVGAAMNIGLNLIFIPTAGYVGAALATTATYLFLWIGISVACHRVLYSPRHSCASPRLSMCETTEP